MDNMILKMANDHSRDKPFLFEVGQEVKVRKFTLDDGQTKGYWIKQRCVVLNQIRTMIAKRNYYRLQHPNGAIDDFEEDELDYRFIKSFPI